MKKISFRVDEETLAALRELEKTVGAKVRGRTSILLRRLILAAASSRSREVAPP